jgi:hypothetical protein
LDFCWEDGSEKGMGELYKRRAGNKKADVRFEHQPLVKYRSRN